VRLEERKVAEIEESGEKMEKEPEGSYEKVSKTLFLGLVTNERKIDKI
jgi:hypothetical protein